MTIPSSRHFVGKIIDPNGRPQNVEFITKERPDFSSAERAAGISWVDSRYKEGNALRYGAKGDDSTDNYQAIENALSVAAQGGFVYFPEGIYRTSDRHSITASGIRVYGEGFKSVIKLTGTHTSNKAVFLVPANGDNDGGTVDGGDNVLIENLQLDGSLAVMSSGVSSGIRCFHGEGHVFRNLWIHDFEAMGVLLQSIGASAEFSATVDTVYSYLNNNGSSTGQGIGIESANDDATRITINNAFCYDNGGASYGRGINIGSGSATLNNCWCWGNGAGGVKTSGNDNQHVILNNCHLNDNTDQGFTTTGTFRLLEFNNCTFDNNTDHGLQIAHAGKALINNCYSRSNGDIGLKIDAGEVQIGNFVSEENTNQGVNITAGNVQASCIKTESNGDEGVRIGTNGICHIHSIISVDDCTDGVQSASITVQPASTGVDLYIASINAADSAANVTNALDLVNSNISNALIGKITVSSITNEINDAANDTMYLARPRSKTTTTTALNDITDDVNTNNLKVEGSTYFNATTNQPVWAAGNAASNVWVDATGTTAHTPV